MVGLQRAARYTVSLPLQDFWCADRKLCPMPWPAEKLHVVARFREGPALTGNLDMAGMRLMYFWRGTPASSAVSVQMALR